MPCNYLEEYILKKINIKLIIINYVLANLSLNIFFYMKNNFLSIIHIIAFGILLLFKEVGGSILYAIISRVIIKKVAHIEISISKCLNAVSKIYIIWTLLCIVTNLLNLFLDYKFVYNNFIINSIFTILIMLIYLIKYRKKITQINRYPLIILLLVILLFLVKYIL